MRVFDIITYSGLTIASGFMVYVNATSGNIPMSILWTAATTLWAVNAVGRLFHKGGRT